MYLYISERRSHFRSFSNPNANSPNSIAYEARIQRGIQPQEAQGSTKGDLFVFPLFCGSCAFSWPQILCPFVRSRQQAIKGPVASIVCWKLLSDPCSIKRRLDTLVRLKHHKTGNSAHSTFVDHLASTKSTIARAHPLVSEFKLSGP